MEHGSRFPTQASGRLSRGSPTLKVQLLRLGATLSASLVVMYFLAFSQIDQPANFQWSLSVFWISLSMVSAMGVIMLIAMPRMVNRNAKAALFVVFGLLLVGAFVASRAEAGVGDDAFLRSMIPHHARAIHMCENAKLTDPEIVQLCGSIVDSQSREIAQMKQIEARRGG